MLPTWPELGMLFAIPNGAGVRHQMIVRAGVPMRVSKEANKLRREGLTQGVWDVAFLWPRGKFHGLIVEHKAHGNDLSTPQVDWGCLAAEAGYETFVSWDAADTINRIVAYWALGLFTAP